MKANLFSGVLGSAVIRILNTVLGIGLAILLGRVLGVDGYGIYSFYFSIISLLIIPAQLGLPTLVLRETSKGRAKNNWGKVQGIWRWSIIISLLSSLIISSLLFLVFGRFPDVFANSHQIVLAWGIVLVSLIPLIRIYGGALRGLEQPFLGNFPDEVLRPFVFISFLMLFVWTWPLNDISPEIAMALHVVASFFVLILSYMIMRQVKPREFLLESLPTYEGNKWLLAAIPIAFAGGMQQILKQTDILLLGVLQKSASDVGIYRVASQGATIVLFLQSAISMVVAPKFASLHAVTNTDALQKMVTRAARVSFLASIPIAFMFILWGKELISLVFGVDYSDGAKSLMILSIGYMIWSFFGHAGLLLNMTGYEKRNLRAILVALLLNVILNIVLIPYFGLSGAAYSTAISLFTWQILLWNDVRRFLSIDCMAIRSVQ